MKFVIDELIVWFIGGYINDGIFGRFILMKNWLIYWLRELVSDWVIGLGNNVLINNWFSD